MKVRDLLAKGTHELVTVWPTDKIPKVASVLAEHNIGAVPILDGDRTLLGILSERDISRAVARYGEKVVELRAADIMTSDVATCSPQDPVKSAIELMQKHHIRHLPVIEGARELIAVLSIRDALAGLLEEYREEAALLRERAAVSRLRTMQPPE
ncbi:MAG: CBS domain-containing protein [Thermoleophilia bacterium]